MGRLLSESTFVLFIIVILCLCVLASGAILAKSGIPPDSAPDIVSSVAAAADRAISESVSVMVRQWFQLRVVQADLTTPPS
jgi:hypothetical protein